MANRAEINKELLDLFNGSRDRHAQILESSTKNVIEAYRESLAAVRGLILEMYERAGGNPDLAFMNSFNRLQNLEKAILNELSRLRGKSVRLNSKAGKDAWLNSYYGFGYALETTIGTPLGFVGVSPDVVVANLQNDYAQINWQPREAINRTFASLNQRLRQTINEALIQGFSADQASARVRGEFEKSVSNNMTRILRTETLRAQSAGALHGFNVSERHAKRNEIDIRRIWKSTIDRRTRPGFRGRRALRGGPNHRTIDGRAAKLRENDNFDVPTFRFDDGVTTPAPGFSGVAGHDINCRCTLITEIGTLTPNVNDLIEERKGGITYDEWQELKGISNAPI